MQYEPNLSDLSKTAIHQLDDLISAHSGKESLTPHFRALRESLEAIRTATSFQQQVTEWLKHTFGPESGEREQDYSDRRARFLEEAVELFQALGTTPAEIRTMVGYVYDRPIGTIHEEAGGTLLTLAALLSVKTVDLDLNQVAQDELKKAWRKVEHVRAKDASRDRSSVLPGVSDPAV